MADDTTNEPNEPVVHDRRRVDPETGKARASAGGGKSSAKSKAGSASDDVPLIDAEGPDVETLTDEELSFLESGEQDLLAEMRNDLARAQADLVNFRMRVERDRAANRDAVIAEVVRTLLPALDDLSRAEAHGDLEGSPLELVAQKLRAGFERYGLKSVGVKGDPFDPNFHEAIVQIPTPHVVVETIAEVIEPGYSLGERLLRAAKVSVLVPDGQ
jgi:molecular chaperone GrpE